MHPRLSPVNSGRLGYLYGTSALYHSPSQAVFNGGRLIPGSGSPEFLPGDEPRGPFRILPPLEASVASAAEFLRFAILCLRCTMPAGLAFSPASAASLLWTGHPARYPFRACHRFTMSRRPEESFGTGLQKTLDQKRNDPSGYRAAALEEPVRFPQPISLTCTLSGVRQMKRPVTAVSSAVTPSLRLKRTLPDCPARFHDTDRDFRSFIQSIERYGRLTGSDSCPRIPQHTLLNL